jgi:hypothetical protein
MARADPLRAYGCYCGCCGAVAGGGVAVGSSVGVEAGSRYQAMISARTTAAAMMSNLFVSIGPPLFSCPTRLAPLRALRQVKPGMGKASGVAGMNRSNLSNTPLFDALAPLVR